MAVYSPYVILNQTGLPINIKSKSLLHPSKVAAGQRAWAEQSEGESSKPLPFLFSYGNDDGQNRVVLCVGDSSWSRPQSLDAIGSAVEVILPSPNKQTELHVGLSVSEGEGKVCHQPVSCDVVGLLTPFRSIN